MGEWWDLPNPKPFMNNHSMSSRYEMMQDSSAWSQHWTHRRNMTFQQLRVWKADANANNNHSPSSAVQLILNDISLKQKPVDPLRLIGKLHAATVRQEPFSHNQPVMKHQQEKHINNPSTIRAESWPSPTRPNPKQTFRSEPGCDLSKFCQTDPNLTNRQPEKIQ